MEENVKELNDPVFDEVNKKTLKDQEMAEECVTDIVAVIQKSLEEKNDFTTKHGFLALGRSIVYLTQTFCKDSEHFEEELVKANELTVDKIMYSLMPEVKDGKLVDPSFDMEDVSLRRVIMALGASVDYAFWRNELSQYAQRRAELESENLSKQEASSEE